MLLAQILSVVIFTVMFVLIILEKFERHHITLVSGALTLLLVFGVSMHSLDAIKETLSIHSMFVKDFWLATDGSHETSTGINWATVIFIVGMMIMVEGMARVGFFRWLCMRLAKMVNYKVKAIFIVFMIMSAFLAMFIDSITVILFLATVTIELSQLLKFNPLPMILSEIFCANLGGSATMSGDPPNIIIGTSFGYSFTDFICNTGTIAGIALVFVIIYFYIAYKKDIKVKETVDVSLFPTPEAAITDKKGFVISTIIFIAAIVLLITHANTGLSVATIGLLISIVTLVTAPRHIPEILKKVDYKTVLFFIGLFIVVSGLEQTGILTIIASFIGKISGGNVYLMIGIIIWISAIASAFIDNIPFAATMIPVIQTLSATTGVPLTTMTWALAMGTDVGGSATPIGASANVVGIAVAGKAGYPIGWKIYCAKAVPATIITMLISTIYIFIFYL